MFDLKLLYVNDLKLVFQTHSIRNNSTKKKWFSWIISKI